MHLTFKGASTYTNLATVCVVLLLVGVQQSGQTKVCDLDVIGRLHQHVPSSQVSVDQPSFLQVHHALKEKGNMTAFFFQQPFISLNLKTEADINVINVNTSMNVLS